MKNKILSLLVLLVLFIPVPVHAQFSGSDVSILLRETDQATTTGIYRIHLNNGSFTIEKNTASTGGFGTLSTIFSFTNGILSFPDVTTVSIASLAPVGATFITQTTNSDLTAEQALSTLATGVLKNTTGTGVLSIATAGVDYAAATITLTAGAGLTGGGDISANRTFTIGAGTGITVNADDVQVDLSVVATTTNTITLANKTLTTPTIGSFANATHTHTAAAGGGTLTEAALVLSDVTSNDVSVSVHGFVPKAPNDTAKFLRGDATWATPAGAGDVSSNTATSVVSELALFADTTGKLIKRATGTGIAYVASGVLVVTTVPTIGDFTSATHTHLNAAGGGTLTEGALSFSDVTTNNASASNHGFLPKLSGSATDFLKGDGTWGAATAGDSTIHISSWRLDGPTTSNLGNNYFTVWTATGTSSVYFEFAVPQEWDGSSDFVFAFMGRMSTAVASQNVALNAYCDVMTDGGSFTASGAITVSDTFVWETTTTGEIKVGTNLKITGAQAATKGNVAKCKMSRNNSVGTNHAGDLGITGFHVRFN